MFPLNCSLSIYSQDCILLWTVDVDLWSNSVDWWGLKFMTHTPPSTEHSAGVSLHPVLPASHPHHRQLEQGRCWAGKVQIKQLEQYLMWPLWLTRNWSSCFNVICACWMARLPPVMLGLGLRPQNVSLGLGLEGCGLGLDHIVVIIKLLRTVAYVMVVK